MSLTEWLVGHGLSWHVPVAEKGYDNAHGRRRVFGCLCGCVENSQPECGPAFEVHRESGLTQTALRLADFKNFKLRLASSLSSGFPPFSRTTETTIFTLISDRLPLASSVCCDSKTTVSCYSIHYSRTPSDVILPGATSLSQTMGVTA